MPLVSLLLLWTCRLGFHILYSNFVYATLQCKHTFPIPMNCYTIICYMNSITTNREFFSEFLVKQTRAGGLWEAVAPLPGGLGGRPPHCRETGPPGVSAQILCENFCRKAPAAPQRGDQVPVARQRCGRVYSCKFRK